MFERVVVIGGGVAGVAAAWAAAQRGSQLRLFDAGVGASSLYGGAVDDRPWEEVARSIEVLGAPPEAVALPESVRTFATDLGLWRLPEAGAPLSCVATEAGRVRVCRGCEGGLLDLSRLPKGARILLPRIMRPEWDADALARSLSSDAYAHSRDYEFEAVEAAILKRSGEERIPAADLAARHDDPARRRWLVERLSEMMARAGRADAILLGPWLGTREPLAATVSEALGVAVGEMAPTVGGALGLRYERARETLLASSGVEVERGRAVAVVEGDEEIGVRLQTGERVDADAVVLALGGMVSGGIVYDAPERHAGQHCADGGGRPFRLSVDVPGAVLQACGAELDVVGSMHGPPLDSVAWPVDADPGFLEAVGVKCRGLEVAPRVFAAGDVVADMPRTILEAAFLGIVAGAAAAGEPGAIAS